MPQRSSTGSMATSIANLRRGTPSKVMQLEGKRALITGAGSGIGRALAIEASRLGMTVALCGRRAEPLHATFAEMKSSGRHLRLSGDITVSAVRRSIRDYLWRHWRSL